MWNRLYTYDEYRDYIMNSQTWQWKRQEVFQRAQYRCEHCGAANVPMHCHHTAAAYKFPLGDEPIELLRCWCCSCHKEYHRPGEITLADLSLKISAL